MSFRFKRLAIPEVIYIETDIFEDSRGHFAELYKVPEFKVNGIPDGFVQVNTSHSKKDVLRGLHYQKNPKAQGKLISVMAGDIFDVAVDIRVGSPTFGQWVGVELNAAKKNMLYVPAGFAHGFCTLSAAADIFYFCTENYSSENERGILWNDPELAIQWPAKNPLLSEKDLKLPALKNADNNFRYVKG